MERFFVALLLRMTYFFDKLIQGAVNRLMSKRLSKNLVTVHL